MKTSLTAKKGATPPKTSRNYELLKLREAIPETFKTISLTGRNVLQLINIYIFKYELCLLELNDTCLKQRLKS